MNILKEILKHKKATLDHRKREVPLEQIQRQAAASRTPARFKARIASAGCHLIAEVKKASPSAGIIKTDFDPVSISCAYAQGGAACLSVLTEEKFFQGHLRFLDDIRRAVSLPVLRKDFIIDPYQIFESKARGADSILLIAKILKKDDLRSFVGLSERLGLDVIVEVHDARELKAALDAGAPVIGVNTRNLGDFSVNLKILPGLLKKIPKGRTVICESGIKTLEDLDYVKKHRVNAVLVGETLMRAKDIAAKTREFADRLSS